MFDEQLAQRAGRHEIQPGRGSTASAITAVIVGGFRLRNKNKMALREGQVGDPLVVQEGPTQNNDASVLEFEIVQVDHAQRGRLRDSSGEPRNVRNGQHDVQQVQLNDARARQRGEDRGELGVAHVLVGIQQQRVALRGERPRVQQRRAALGRLPPDDHVGDTADARGLDARSVAAAAAARALRGGRRAHQEEEDPEEDE